METYIKIGIGLGIFLVLFLIYFFRKKIADFLEDDDYEDELEELKEKPIEVKNG